MSALSLVIGGIQQDIVFSFSLRVFKIVTLPTGNVSEEQIYILHYSPKDKSICLHKFQEGGRPS